MRTGFRKAPGVGLASVRVTRRGEILRLMRKLEWDGFPRLQMLLLVMLTGAAGMAASYALLRAGVGSMSARYPLSVGCAYIVFLFLLWLWLRTKAEDYVDSPPDFPQTGGSQSCSSANIEHDPAFSGEGGQFGGGGASGHFELDDSLPSPSLLDGNASGGDSVGETVGEIIGGADEAAVPLIIALLIAGVAATLLFGTLYVVYLAPTLFAELLVDGVLSASLYRRMRGLQTRHWLESALRRTTVPFAVTALTLGVIGYFFQMYAPDAHTIGKVLQQYHRGSLE